MAPDWIAIDWGTTNLRVWAMTGEGTVLAEGSSDQGMLNVSGGAFEPALLALVSEWLPEGQTTLALASGMVGARQGWVEAPYASVPAKGIKTGNTIRVPVSDPRLDMRILPGLCQQTPADVMRGEETQIFGFLASHPGFNGMICLPGTHSKWVQVSDGQIIRFHTAMTGELFQLLSERSVLKHSMTGGWDDAAFAKGVEDGIAKPEALTANLFAIRAASLLQDVPEGSGEARLSGMLIGAEFAAVGSGTSGIDAGAIALIGSGHMIEIYQKALASRNVEAVTFDAGIATRAGLTQAYRAIQGATV